MLRCKGSIAWGWLILGLWAVTETGTAAEATVSGTGEVTLRPIPTTFRVRVELSSQAGTVKTAMARLQQRREAAMAKLKTLEADADSVAFGHSGVLRVDPFSAASGYPTASYPSPSYSSGSSFSPPPPPALTPYAPSTSSYAAPVPNRPARGTRVVKVPPLYRASTTFSVDWPLAAENMDEVLVAAEALKKKIAAADLAGAKQPDQLTPEEQEILEEAAVRPSAYTTTLSPRNAQNGLQFLFVARVSPEQRKAALAKAFAKAKAEAGEMAGAADRDLGPLLSLDGQFRRGAGFGFGGHVYPVAARSIYQGPAPSHDADESVESDPRSIAFCAQVHASFRLP